MLDIVCHPNTFLFDCFCYCGRKCRGRRGILCCPNSASDAGTMSLGIRAGPSHLSFLTPAPLIVCTWDAAVALHQSLKGEACIVMVINPHLRIFAHWFLGSVAEGEDRNILWEKHMHWLLPAPALVVRESTWDRSIHWAKLAKARLIFFKEDRGERFGGEG